jgi:hypothetical protein
VVSADLAERRGRRADFGFSATFSFSTTSDLAVFSVFFPFLFGEGFDAAAAGSADATIALDFPRPLP